MVGRNQLEEEEGRLMHPCRDHTPQGFARMAERRWIRRARGIANRINGRARAHMRALGYESPHAAPVYPALAMKVWR